MYLKWLTNKEIQAMQYIEQKINIGEGIYMRFFYETDARQANGIPTESSDLKN